MTDFKSLYHKYRGFISMSDLHSAVYYANRLIRLGYAEGECYYTRAAIFDSAYCHVKLDHPDSAIREVSESFNYITPTGEILSMFALAYHNSRLYENAVVWGEHAVAAPKPEEGSLPMVRESYYHFTPLINLASSYLKVGKTEEAIKSTERAAKYNPDDRCISNNREVYKKHYPELYEKIVVNKSDVGRV